MWLKKQKLKANGDKAIHVTFTLKRDNCPPVYLNMHQMSQANNAKYLGMHLDLP